jgi:O-antigen ligase
VLIVAGVVGLVWGMVFVWRGSLMAGCLGVLLATSCLGTAVFKLELGPIPLSMDRAALALVLGAYVVQRWLGRADPKPLTRADVALALFVGLLSISWAVTDYSAMNLRPVAPFWRLVSGYLTPALLYWVVRQSTLDQRSVAWANGCLACLGLYLAVIGLAEITGQWWLVFPKASANPELGEHFGRARGPLLSAVSYGTYVDMALLAAWVWRVHLPHAARVLVCLTAPLYLAAVFFSYTRSVWMGAAGGLAVLLLLTLRGPWRTLVLAAVVAGGLLLVGGKTESLVGFKREQSATETAESASLRVSFAYVSWKMFLDRPLFGSGFSTFPAAKLEYLGDRSTKLHLELLRPYVHHNTYLSVLTDCGAAGLGLFLAVLGLWGHNAWRLYRDPSAPEWMQWQGALLLAALLVYGVQALFHEVSYLPADNVLMFFLAGTTTGLWAGRQRDRAEARG